MIVVGCLIILPQDNESVLLGASILGVVAARGAINLILDKWSNLSWSVEEYGRTGMIFRWEEKEGRVGQC